MRGPFTLTEPRWLQLVPQSIFRSSPPKAMFVVTGAPRTVRVRPPKLLDRVREANRLRHGSRSTEKSYLGWIRRYIVFHGKRHPAEMGAPEVAHFLSSLAVEGRVAASTQNQARSALLFLYRHVLHQDLPWLHDVVRARQSKHLAVVLTRDEVRAVISKRDGAPRLMATLLYGSGLRLLECARLRVQDVDFAMNQIVVRDGKGAKDRVTVLPAVAKEPLTQHLRRVKRQHEADLAQGAGGSPRPPRQARDTAYLPALVRHTFARGRARHSHGPGAARTQRRQHDDDLYARAQPRTIRRDKPRRPRARPLIPTSGCGTDG